MPPVARPRMVAHKNTIHQQQQQQPQTQTHASTTAQPSVFLNGAGLWRSWTRSFNSPLLALLEIFDNAVDAANDHDVNRAGAASLPRNNRQPKIQALPDDFEQTSVAIRNSCTRPIPPMSYVLKLYNSTKSDESIGENGIGIKQACASLSDLSFILTKSSNTRLELGILMKDLQTDDRFVAPQCTLSIDGSTAGSSSSSIDAQLRQRMHTNPHTFGAAFTAYGGGNPTDGIDLLVQHFHHLRSHPDWKDHPNVFCVILSNLRHSGGSLLEEDHVGQESNQGCDNKNRSTRLLQTLKRELPKTYLHINDMDVSVNDGSVMEQIRFQYWEHRLVELTKFEIKVDPKIPFYQADSGWLDEENVFDEGYENRKETIRIFLGFDPVRLKEEGAGGCPLHIHSRWSGRLIKSMNDARRDLGLSVGGTEYAQGLTVIVDDYEAALPLNPTKQDISFGSRSLGHIHEQNFMGWVAGVVYFYWHCHNERFGGQKAALTLGVEERFDDIQELRFHQSMTATLNNGDFTTYADINWRKQSRKVPGMLDKFNHTIRVPKSSISEAKVAEGRDSKVQLDYSNNSKPKSKVKSQKRKSSASRSSPAAAAKKKAKASATAFEDDDGSSEESEVYQPRATSLRQITKLSAQTLDSNERAAYEQKVKELEEKAKEADNFKSEFERWRNHAQKCEKKITKYKSKIQELESTPSRQQNGTHLPMEIKLENNGESSGAANAAVTQGTTTQSLGSPGGGSGSSAALKAENASLRRALERINQKSKLRKQQLKAAKSQLEAMKQEKQMIESDFRRYRDSQPKQPEFIDLCGESSDEDDSNEI
jgi:hypothetical protein